MIAVRHCRKSFCRSRATKSSSLVYLAPTFIIQSQAMTLTRMLWGSTGRQIVIARRSGSAIASRSYSDKNHRDHQSIESNPGPQKKNYDDAKSYHEEKDNSLSEGASCEHCRGRCTAILTCLRTQHSVPRSSQPRTFQDKHTQVRGGVHCAIGLEKLD